VYFNRFADNLGSTTTKYFTMKSIVLAVFLAGIAHALPSPPPAGSNEPATPKVLGELPKEGLKSMPYPNFDDLASLLGFDPSKAKSDGKG
jgi:hypothetical protein